MVPLRDLDDDYMNSTSVTTACGDVSIIIVNSLGDTVQVKVAKANLEKKQLDYALVRE